MNMQRTWRLLRDGAVIADLVVTDQDWPWLQARIDRQDGFAAVEPLFAQELRLLDQLDDQLIEAWDDAYRQVRAVVSLVAPNGAIVPEFLLHVDGEQAWWRWSYEPFSED